MSFDKIQLEALRQAGAVEHRREPIRKTGMDTTRVLAANLDVAKASELDQQVWNFCACVELRQDGHLRFILLLLLHLLGGVRVC